MDAVTLLSTERLSRRIGGVLAVDAIDFALRERGVRAIIGPNGAGKTTFVNLICGRLPPSAGRILFAGEDITWLPAHRRVGRGIAYTFQITSIFGNLSVFDNIALAVQSRMHRDERRRPALPPGEIAHHVEEALARVGLEGRAGIKAADLPYGHQRLLEVAMGLALAPRLLILDEPTQGLSDLEIDRFCGLVLAIAREETVLLIEHNMTVVMRLADTVTVMNQGRILAEGAPDDIRANAAVQQAYLGA